MVLQETQKFIKVMLLISRALSNQGNFYKSLMKEVQHFPLIIIPKV